MDFYSAEAVIFLIAELDNPFRGELVFMKTS